MAVIWCFPAMKMNLRQWLSCKEMVFVCVIWSFDDMGLGEQVILSDKESKGGYDHTGNGVSWSQFEWKTYDTQMTVTFEDSLKVESISKNGKFKCIMEPYPGNELDF